VPCLILATSAVLVRVIWEKLNRGHKAIAIRLVKVIFDFIRVGVYS